MKTVHQIFVYGSLVSGFPGKNHQLISKYFTLIGKAKVKGFLYDLGEYPAAVPAMDKNFIFGELYNITEVNEFSNAISQLDDYEGVNVEFAETPLYRRELTDVFLNDNILTAWIYWYNKDISDKPIISSGDVLQSLHK
jgi:gamma-glutamylcyclotransferase (GGCT)/AIG2-like uncharacterized protein YtfP